ncbi:CitB Response regulator containing a CheY-like receiver domain and an HTH DNA-binding domain [Candidatus Nanopelagicaceae bacterium]
MKERPSTRVLVAEDEEFTLNLLRDILSGANFQVESVQNVADAIAKIATFDPHAVITDLNFGVSAPSGADLLQFIEKDHPWIGKVVLTSHASPNLAIPSGVQIPDGVTYLVKSELGSISELITAVEGSITKSNLGSSKPVLENDRIVISSTQSEILLLLAEGYTNSAIARKRGTSLRAAETLIQRTFASLGIQANEDFNPRILAVRMWQQGKVVVK